jgi:hypothetical protein
LHEGDHFRKRIDKETDASCDEIDDRLIGAFVRHVHDIDLRRALEELAAQMRRRAVARGREMQLAGAAPRQRDQLFHVLHRQRRVGDEQEGRRRNQYHRREIAQRIVRELRIEARVDRETRKSGQHGVAVRRRLRNDLRSDVAACAGSIIDEDLLPEGDREVLSDRACDDVGRAARRKRRDPAYGLAGIGGARRRLCRGNDRG